MVQIVNFDRGKQNDSKVQFMSFKHENGIKAFYVRFYVPELEEEFKEIMECYRKSNVSVYSEEKQGTYVVYTNSGDEQPYSSGAWDILMHKYWSYSKEIRKDDVTGEKFYPVRFSDMPIKSCGRKLVV